MKKLIGTLPLMASMNVTAITIDDFTVADFPHTDSVIDGVGIVSFVSNASIASGERDLYVELLTSDGGGTTEATIGAGFNRFEFSTTSGESGVAKLQYDGADAGGAITSAFGSGINLDGVYFDLTVGGGNAFSTFVTFADAGFAYQVNTWDAAMSNSATFISPGGTNFVETTPFDDPQFAGVDFTQIDALEIVIDPLGSFVSLDLSIGSFNVVDEPAPLALLSLGLIGMGLIRRKR